MTAGDTRSNDLDITKAGGGGSPTSTQTRGSDAGSGGGNAQPTPGGSAGAGNGGGGTPSGEGGGDAFAPDADGKYTHPETKEKVDAAVIAKYYRDQFGASTRGAQELLSAKSTLEGELGTTKGQVEKLTKDLEELRVIAEGKNPEGLNLKDLQAKFESTATELALLKENAALDAFEKTAPLAASKREALRSLARANPKTDLQKLWDENLKAGAEAESAAAEAKKKAQEAGAGERGKGTSTREPAGSGATVSGMKGDTGLSLEDFNNLPVAKRRELIERYDIR